LTALGESTVPDISFLTEASNRAYITGYNDAILQQYNSAYVLKQLQTLSLSTSSDEALSCGPRNAIEQQSAAGPERSFAAFWETNGDYMFKYIQISKEKLKDIHNKLEQLYRNYVASSARDTNIEKNYLAELRVILRNSIEFRQLYAKVPELQKQVLFICTPDPLHTQQTTIPDKENEVIQSVQVLYDFLNTVIQNLTIASRDDSQINAELMQTIIKQIKNFFEDEQLSLAI